MKAVKTADALAFDHVRESEIWRDRRSRQWDSRKFCYNSFPVRRQQSTSQVSSRQEDACEVAVPDSTRVLRHNLHIFRRRHVARWRVSSQKLFHIYFDHNSHHNHFLLFPQASKNEKSSSPEAFLLGSFASPRLSYRELGCCIQRRIGLTVHASLLLRPVGLQQSSVTTPPRHGLPYLL